MRYDEADTLEITTGSLAIECGCDGLFVFRHPDDTKRIAIAGEKGITILSRKQARTLATELKEIVNMYFGE